jgi:hypothetical protein
MQKTFTCTYCGATFGSQNRLNQHRKVHQEDLRLLCEFCERPFSKKENLLLHLTNMHKDKSNPYACCFCSDAFSSKDPLLAHESLEHSDIICICNNCHLKFVSINQYRQHCRAHLKFSFSYKCKICGVDMAGKDKILDHVNQHKGKGWWQLDIFLLFHSFLSLSQVKCHFYVNFVRVRSVNNAFWKII